MHLLHDYLHHKVHFFSRDWHLNDDGVWSTCVDSRVYFGHLRSGAVWQLVRPPPHPQAGVSALVTPPPRTGCAQPAREDLVPLSTPMSGLTDNTGLTDCSIIARWQGKQQEDSVIYVLNCFYSMRDLHRLSSTHPAPYEAESVQRAPSTVPRSSKSRPRGLSVLMNDRFKCHSDYIGTSCLQRGWRCDCVGDL